MKRISMRKTAMDRVRYMLEALEEHSGDARKDGNDEWADCLQSVLNALYKSDIPDSKGRVKLVLELGKPAVNLLTETTFRESISEGLKMGLWTRRKNESGEWVYILTPKGLRLASK